MKIAKETGVKNFLFISSIDIHGFFGHVEETEDGIYYPSKCYYPQTKKNRRTSGARFHFSPNEDRLGIRPCTVYGPGGHYGARSYYGRHT